MQKKVTPEKGTLSNSRQGESTLESPKEKTAEAEEEEQESEESNEEGEIGESQISARRSTRGGMPAREKREQETYKEKL